MSILIKEMEMPKDGVYWCEIGVAGEIAMITIHGEDRKSFHLVPVPPHGRLIDADVIREDWLENGKNEYVYDTNAFLSSIDDAPTIIQAEESDMDSFIHIFEEDDEEDGMDSFIRILKD